MLRVILGYNIWVIIAESLKNLEYFAYMTTETENEDN